MDWHFIERQAARHGLVPWHIYRALPSIDRAEIIAHFQECNLRDTYRAQKLKEAAGPQGHGSQRDQYFA